MISAHLLFQAPCSGSFDEKYRAVKPRVETARLILSFFVRNSQIRMCGWPAAAPFRAIPAHSRTVSDSVFSPLPRMSLKRDYCRICIAEGLKKIAGDLS